MICLDFAFHSRRGYFFQNASKSSSVSFSRERSCSVPVPPVERSTSGGAGESMDVCEAGGHTLYGFGSCPFGGLRSPFGVLPPSPFGVLPLTNNNSYSVLKFDISSFFITLRFISHADSSSASFTFRVVCDIQHSSQSVPCDGWHFHSLFLWNHSQDSIVCL